MSDSLDLEISEIHSLQDIDHEETIDFSDNDPINLQKKLEKYCTPKRKMRQFKGMNASQLRQVLQEQGGVIKFCQEMGLFAESATCECGKEMKLSPSAHLPEGFFWRCRLGHDKSFSLRKGTFFENSRKSLTDILFIMYMWVHEYSYASIMHESDESPETIYELCLSCSEICKPILECKNDPLGGENQLVEVFECKYKEDKIDSKKSKNKQWVFCALELYSTKTILVILPDKKSDTLYKAFDKYILPGTTLTTHVWNTYKELNANHFEYLTTVKSFSFYDSATKSEMKTVDDFHSVTDRPPPGLNRWTKFEYNSNFCEYFYRKSLLFAPDAYLSFLKDIALIYKPVVSLSSKDDADSNFVIE